VYSLTNDGSGDVVVHEGLRCQLAATICLGTINAGMWVSHDNGQSWQVPMLAGGALRGERDVRAIAASQLNPSTIFATIEGDPGSSVIVRSDDFGDTFEAIGAPLVGHDVWSLAVSPYDPDLMFAGTRPARMLRSKDGGLTWDEVQLGAAAECRIGATRLTSIVFGESPSEVWAGVEIGGVFHSVDCGETWALKELSGGEALLAGNEMWLDERHLDIHSLAWSASGRLSVATPIGFFSTTDRGASWASTRFGSGDRFDREMFYTRSVLVDPSGEALFAGVGVKPPHHGLRGGINRSDDGGISWKPVSPVLGSVVWGMASSRFVSDTFAAVCLNGQVVVSTDGGRDWQAVERSFGETRAIAITSSQAAYGRIGALTAPRTG
jgi:photosystem II stability/assembly factor-like uncharacterized protein